MNSIYIQTLKLGFENPDGISLNDVVKKLNIVFNDDVFEVNYTKWFYMNFYNKFAEAHVLSEPYPKSENRIRVDNIEKIRGYSDDKSYIKGDAVNKFIDYLDLSEARKTSKSAHALSIISIIIAIITMCCSVIFK